MIPIVLFLVMWVGMGLLAEIEEIAVAPGVGLGADAHVGILLAAMPVRVREEDAVERQREHHQHREDARPVPFPDVLEFLQHFGVVDLLFLEGNHLADSLLLQLHYPVHLSHLGDFFLWSQRQEFPELLQLVIDDLRRD